MTYVVKVKDTTSIFFYHILILILADKGYDKTAKCTCRAKNCVSLMLWMKIIYLNIMVVTYFLYLMKAQWNYSFEKMFLCIMFASTTILCIRSYIGFTLNYNIIKLIFFYT